MEPTPIFSQPEAQTPTPAVASAAGRAAAKKAWPAITIHPLQHWSLRYVAFMLAEAGKTETVEQCAREAFAIFLHRMQRQGVEFPAKKLAELLELGLIKS